MSDDKNTPIWKKEISFRRKSDEGTPESDTGSASHLEEGFSLGKKDMEGEADGVPAHEAEIEVVAEPEAPLEAAPTADLDLIAKYAPLPDPVLPPAPPPPAPVAEARASRRRSSTTG